MIYRVRVKWKNEERFIEVNSQTYWAVKNMQEGKWENEKFAGESTDKKYSGFFLLMQILFLELGLK